MFGKEWSSYKIVNCVMFLLLAALFIYVGVFYNPGKTTCIVKLKTGLDCNSCGLTRDFYSILHLNVIELINVHSLQIFSFFIFQIIARGTLILYSKGDKLTISLDALISSITFLISFYPLLTA